MNKEILIFSIMTLFVLLSGCLTMPTLYFEEDEAFIEESQGNVDWRKIAVLPFTGNPALRRVSAELFSFHMNKQQHFEVIGPAIAGIELKKKGVELADKKLELEEALEAGRLLGVDAVIVGSVSEEFKERLKVGVSLIDIGTGRVIVTSINPSVLMLKGSQERLRRAAPSSTEKVAYDILSVLYKLAGQERSLHEKDVVPRRMEENREDLY